MFSSTKTGHLAHIIATSLVGQAAAQGLVPPDPSKIENYGHLLIQAVVAIVTIWATVRKALQKPENVVKAPVLGVVTAPVAGEATTTSAVAMALSKPAGSTERAAPQLSPAQLLTQAARLAQAVPHLAAAYVRALGRWQGDPVLRLVGRPIITECYRSAKRQDELYAQGRTAPGPVVTYKRGGESRHNTLPSVALDVAFVLPGGDVVVGAAAEQVCAAGEGGRRAGALGRRLAGVQGPAPF